MIAEVRMPRLDEDMTEGTVVRWLKREGEPVQKGDPLVEIETQKVTYEIEAPVSGLLRIVLVSERELVPITTVLGVIAGREDDIHAYRPPASPAVQDRDAVVSDSLAPTSSRAGGETQRIMISPLARKLAAERGVDISLISGTGPGGAITKEDVLGFRHPRPQGRRVLEGAPLSGIRKVIADRMLESWRSIPRAEHFMTADVTELATLRAAEADTWEQTRGLRPSVNDMVIAATARALKRFPEVNASIREGDPPVREVYGEVNIGMAVALDGGGVITPVLRDVGTRDVFEIARETRRLAELVRSGRHSLATLSGGTFTITNLGMFDVEFFVPVINPPEGAILAVGKVSRKPTVVDDAIAIRSLMTLCLAFDHRLLDGVMAARFLQAVKQRLEAPRDLLSPDTDAPRR